jgi:hypothetical protein
LAAGNGHEAVVRLLVEKGADVDAKDNDGGTALRWAAGSGGMRRWCSCSLPSLQNHLSILLTHRHGNHPSFQLIHFMPSPSHLICKQQSDGLT